MNLSGNLLLVSLITWPGIGVTCRLKRGTGAQVWLDIGWTYFGLGNSFMDLSDNLLLVSLITRAGVGVTCRLKRGTVPQVWLDIGWTCFGLGNSFMDFCGMSPVVQSLIDEPSHKARGWGYFVDSREVLVHKFQEKRFQEWVYLVC